MTSKRRFIVLSPAGMRTRCVSSHQGAAPAMQLPSSEDVPSARARFPWGCSKPGDRCTLTQTVGRVNSRPGEHVGCSSILGHFASGHEPLPRTGTACPPGGGVGGIGANFGGRAPVDLTRPDAAAGPACGSRSCTVAPSPYPLPRGRGEGASLLKGGCPRAAPRDAAQATGACAPPGPLVGNG